jgi:hypothetical protein
VAACVGATWPYQPFQQDALDRDVAWLAELDGPLAGSFQASSAIAFTQTQQTASRAQAVDGRVINKIV